MDRRALSISTFPLILSNVSSDANEAFPSKIPVFKEKEEDSRKRDSNENFALISSFLFILTDKSFKPTT